MSQSILLSLYTLPSPLYSIVTQSKIAKQNYIPKCWTQEYHVDEPFLRLLYSIVILTGKCWPHSLLHMFAVLLGLIHGFISFIEKIAELLVEKLLHTITYMKTLCLVFATLS